MMDTTMQAAPRPDAVDIDALGVGVRISFESDVPPDAREAVREVWRGAHGTRDIVRTVPITASELSVLEYGLSSLSVRVTLEALDAVRGTMVLLHACAVSTPDGAVAAFVGPSGRGKTTAARELSRAWGYVTDETVAVTSTGEVLPYRKPLSVIDDKATPKRQVPMDSALPDSPLRLTALTLLDRDPEGPYEPVVTDVPLVDAIAELIPQLSYFAELDAPLQTLATAIDRVGGVRRVHYREADRLAELLPALLRDRRENDSWSATSAEQIHDGPGYRPATGSDAILSGDRVCVLAGGRFFVLDGIAPTIWDAAHRTGDAGAIEHAVLATHGKPPSGDATALVRAALDELVDEGVLENR